MLGRRLLEESECVLDSSYTRTNAFATPSMMLYVYTLSLENVDLCCRFVVEQDTTGGYSAKHSSLVGGAGGTKLVGLGVELTV